MFFLFILGGITIFALTWAYFDFVCNVRPHRDSKYLMVRWWYVHLVLMLSAIMIGVSLKAQVTVGFMEPCPLKYTAFGCSGLVLFLASLQVIQNVIESRYVHRYAGVRLRLFAIGLIVLTFLVAEYLPSIVGKMMMAIAVFSQVLVPLITSKRTIQLEEPS